MTFVVGAYVRVRLEITITTPLDRAADRPAGSNDLSTRDTRHETNRRSRVTLRAIVLCPPSLLCDPESSLPKSEAVALAAFLELRKTTSKLRASAKTESRTINCTPFIEEEC